MLSVSYKAADQLPWPDHPPHAFIPDTRPLLYRRNTSTGLKMPPVDVKTIYNLQFEDQGKLYLICLPGNMQVSSVAPEGQYKMEKNDISKNLDIILFKSFQKALNASCFLLEHRWIFEPFLIVVFESLNCTQCEKMDLKITQSLLERVQIYKRCWKTAECAGAGGFFWRTVLSLTAQNKQGTREQPSQNIKTVVVHPGNHTQY